MIGIINELKFNVFDRNIKKPVQEREFLNFEFSINNPILFTKALNIALKNNLFYQALKSYNNFRGKINFENYSSFEEIIQNKKDLFCLLNDKNLFLYILNTPMLFKKITNTENISSFFSENEWVGYFLINNPDYEFICLNEKKIARGLMQNRYYKYIKDDRPYLERAKGMVKWEI